MLQPMLPYPSYKPARGIALLLVLIALVVGTILTAGFLAVQGTSNGIARNERDYNRCRSLAESGVDMCVWLVRNKSDWRRTLAPGTWLNAFPVADGTVTVVASDGDNSNNFADDNTQPVIFTSTATCNGRTLTITASVTPTGGGTPWATGAFAAGQMTLSEYGQVDSYNSSLGSYSYTAGRNARWWSNFGGADALKISQYADFYGSFITTPLPNPNALNVGYYATAPSSTSPAEEPRTIGRVLPPNTVGFANVYDYPASYWCNLTNNNTSYRNFTLAGGVMCIASSGIYHVRQNLYIDSASTLYVDYNQTVVLIVEGMTTIRGSVYILNGGKLLIYTGGAFDARGYAEINSGNSPSSLLVLGKDSSTSIKVREYASLNAAILAPKAVTEIYDQAQFYGSVVAQNLSVRNSADMHMDDNVRSLKFHNMTGGSTQGDYKIHWQN